MHFKTLSLSLVVAGAAAQSVFTTPTLSTSAPGTTSTSLPNLVAQLPQCALQCFSQAAKDINCAATDFTCLCSNSANLLSKLAPCIALSSCSSDDVNKASQLAPQICNAVSSNPNPSDVASASNLVTSALGTAATTASSSTNAAMAAMRTDMAMGVIGVAGAAGAFAAFGI